GAALALNTACYAYEPAITSGVPAGEQVRVELNPQGTIELARYLGPRVAIVDGTINSVAGDTALLIVVESVQLLDGLRPPRHGHRLRRRTVSRDRVPAPHAGQSARDGPGEAQESPHGLFIRAPVPRCGFHRSRVDGDARSRVPLSGWRHLPFHEHRELRPA